MANDWSDLYDGEEYDDEFRLDPRACLGVFLVVGCVVIVVGVFAAAIWG